MEKLIKAHGMLSAALRLIIEVGEDLPEESEKAHTIESIITNVDQAIDDLIDIEGDE